MSDSKSEDASNKESPAKESGDFKNAVTDNDDPKAQDAPAGDEPPAKKTKLANDALPLVDKAGKQSNNSDSAELNSKKKSDQLNKRESKMLKTAKEGEALLKELGHKDDLPHSERRRTRSQTKGVPIPPAPAKKTNSLKWGKKGRPRKEEVLMRLKQQQEEQEKAAGKEEDAEKLSSDAEDGKTEGSSAKPAAEKVAVKKK